LLSPQGKPIWSRLRPHFWVGVALLAVGHLLIFLRTPSGEFWRPLSDYWFAAVWFGYIFALDALIYARDGRSLFMDRRRVFLATFPLSAAMWWGFEWINEIVKNWHYLRPSDIPDWWAHIVSWVFFSTVIPAVWETADWVAGWGAIRRMKERPAFRVPRALLVGLIVAGVLSFVLPSIWPLYFFPLIWGFLILILDPINYWRGAPSILGHLSRGNWQVPVAFYVGGTICGFLWEFWNYWAFPKWYYTVPFVGEFFKIFEMPLLGYIGYGPFAWEIYALFWCVAGLAPRSEPRALARLERQFVED
jgi:hypothetical protein